MAGGYAGLVLSSLLGWVASAAPSVLVEIGGLVSTVVSSGFASGAAGLASAWVVYLRGLFPTGHPPPPGGYFGRKVFVFNSLPGVSVCKIFKTNELPAKYSIETS